MYQLSNLNKAGFFSIKTTKGRNDKGMEIERELQLLCEGGITSSIHSVSRFKDQHSFTLKLYLWSLLFALNSIRLRLHFSRLGSDY